MMQKHLKNDWNPGIWVLIWEYSVTAIQWIPTWQGLDDFQESLHLCALDKSRLSIWMVKKQILYWGSFTLHSIGRVKSSAVALRVAHVLCNHLRLSLIVWSDNPSHSPATISRLTLTHRVSITHRKQSQSRRNIPGESARFKRDLLMIWGHLRGG